MNAGRILAIVRKDIAELAQHPGALVPPLLLMIASIVPGFIVTIIVPAWSGEQLDGGELTAAARRLPWLAALSGLAQVQAMLFQQFLLLSVTVPIAGSMALAAQSVIGEKQMRTLEPLLATPLRSSELLAAKALTPLLVAGALHVLGLLLYAGGIATLAQPGVLGAIVNTPTVLLLIGAAPLLTLLALQLAVIVSSRVNDARSAQQLAGLVVLPVTALFVAQLVRGFVIGTGPLLVTIAVVAVLNALALFVGVRVFDRERILLNWK
jgi:ABC-2 type transport system permease protein